MRLAAAEPVWIAEVDVGESLTPVGVSRPQHPEDRRARLLVRLHHDVLGFVSIPLTGDPVTPDRVGVAVETQLAATLRHHAAAGPGATDAGPHPVPGAGCDEPLSVVVCTRNRPTILATCLAHLQCLQHRDFEVIVVDNAPATEDTRHCFARVVGDDRRFRYIREPAPGLSRARNRGLAEANAGKVAYTDDDVQVDPWWLDGIAAGFGRDPGAGCVTGLAAPAQLDHASQHYFDRRYSWASHMEPRVFRLDMGTEVSPLYPYSAGIFGTGANFAVDRRLLKDLGGFDEALGAGSPAGGGEDLDAFVRVLRAGRSLVYEPSAIVWHVHRAGAADLRRQLFFYGCGLTAFLGKYLADPRTAREIVGRLPNGARRMLRIWSPAEIEGPAPAVLVLAEALGMVAGPLAYARGRRRLRKVAGPA